MLTKNPQNVHRKYFWAILITFICDVKIDINMCEPHYVYLFFLWTSSIVQVFDYLAIDIFLTINLFEDQHTLPKWNILSQSCYCCYWPFRTSTPSQSEIFSQIYNKSFETEYFTLGGCAGPERPIHRTSNNNSFSQNISLWEGVLVLKGQYIEQATITAFHRIFHY